MGHLTINVPLGLEEPQNKRYAIGPYHACQTSSKQHDGWSWQPSSMIYPNHDGSKHDHLGPWLRSRERTLRDDFMAPLFVSELDRQEIEILLTLQKVQITDGLRSSILARSVTSVVRQVQQITNVAVNRNRPQYVQQILFLSTGYWCEIKGTWKVAFINP